jgi:universal stress protein E
LKETHVKAQAWQSLLVVIADPFARTQPALRKAAEIARRSGARLTLFNAFMVPQPVPEVALSSHKEILSAAIRQRRERLRTLAAGARLGKRVDCVVRWDYPVHEAIVREVLRTRPDVLLTDSHRHGRLARWVLANTDWELIRSCPCPLWFVRSPELPRAPSVVVAIDPRHTHAKPTRLDDRLLTTARSLTETLGGRISLVHAYDVPATMSPGMLLEPVRLPLPPERERAFVASMQKDVGRLAQRHDIAARDCHIEAGPPSDVIARIARRRKAHVLVMGAVSRSQLARPIIGNTAERVIDHVDCDVFVVKPAGFKTPVPRRSGGTRRPGSPHSR